MTGSDSADDGDGGDAADLEDNNNSSGQTGAIVGELPEHAMVLPEAILPSDEDDMQVTEDPKNEKQAATAELWQQCMKDVIMCVICHDSCPIPIRQCKDCGKVICSDCIHKGKIKQCPMCRVTGGNYPRVRGLEEMARNMQWQCKGEGCSITTEYDDMATHAEKCRFVISFMCPLPNCSEVLSYHSNIILSHMQEKHQIVPLELAERMQGCKPDTVSFVVEQFDSDKRIARPVLLKSSGIFVLCTAIDTQSDVRFRSFYFTDADDIEEVRMKKRFIKSANETIISRERVKCISELQYMRNKSDLHTLNESIVIDKGGFAASFFTMQAGGKWGKLQCAIRLYVDSAIVHTSKYKVPRTSPSGGGGAGAGGRRGLASV